MRSAKVYNTVSKQALVLLSAIFLLTACSSGPSNKWRIEFSESAKSTGNLTFRIAPEGAEAFDVDITVFDGTSENQVAHRVKNEMLEQLPADRFSVEVDDGEDVLLKKRKGEDFRLNLVSNTVKSVRVNLDRE